MRRLLFLVLLVCCCMFFDNIYQPPSVTLGEHFVITITGNYYPAGCPGTWWLAMMMPTGFEIDSIRYLSSDSLTGLVTEIDSGMSEQFEIDYPADPNMNWLAYSTQDLSADSNGTFVVTVYAYAGMTAVPGEYLLDYYIGHFIGCGSSYADKMLDLPLSIDPTGITEDTRRIADDKYSIFPSVFRNRLNIRSKRPCTFKIYSSDGRFIKSLHVEDFGFWDGRDSRGTKVPTGNYFVTGNGITTKVTLLE